MGLRFGSVSTVRTNLRAQRIAVVGLLVNIALAATKLVAGLMGHSYALVADAVESMTDILGSVVIWGGLRIGARPADENHPWGHGKAESLAALVVAAMVLAAGIGIGIKSIDEIITPHHAPAPFTLGVLIAVVVVKELLFRRVLRIAREEDSGAAEVDAWHHRSDAITSAAAFIGISIALFGERLFGGAGGATAPGEPSRWASADDYAALLASAVIIYNGWRLMRVPLRDLMDADQPGAASRRSGRAGQARGLFSRCTWRSIRRCRCARRTPWADGSAQRCEINCRGSRMSWCTSSRIREPARESDRGRAAKASEWRERPGFR